MRCVIFAKMLFKDAKRMKDNKELSEDDLKRVEKEIDGLMSKMQTQIDEAFKGERKGRLNSLMSETFADKVKALNLPLDQIIVIGSGILDQLGIRLASDIDLAASSDLMKKLSEESGDWLKKFGYNQRFYL